MATTSDERLAAQAELAGLELETYKRRRERVPGHLMKGTDAEAVQGLAYWWRMLTEEQRAAVDAGKDPAPATRAP
jgi:hypothetical protein